VKILEVAVGRIEGWGLVGLGFQEHIAGVLPSQISLEGPMKLWEGHTEVEILAQ
jgi:hypothetical protein